MQKNIKELDKYFIKISIVSLLIVIVSGLESLMLAKSSELINAYIDLNPGLTINDYLGVVLINYFIGIMEPLLLVLYTAFTYKKYGIKKIYKIVFPILLALRMFNIFLSFRTASIFYYIILGLYLLLIIFVAFAPERKRKV